MIKKTDLQAVLDEMKAEDRRTRVEPPTVEEMLAWRRGELSDEDEARVREQLICWPELLRALMTPYPADDAGALPAEVVERQWRAMKRDMGGGGARVLSFRNAITAIAASLAVIFGALLWQARLELRRPRALPQQILLPDAQRGASDGATTLATDGDAYLLTPTLIGEQRFESYRFELADASNHLVWRSGALHHGDDDTFAVLVPRTFLAPGRYKLILYGVNGARQEELGSYSVRVAPR
jgi:hypothetical protein